MSSRPWGYFCLRFRSGGWVQLTLPKEMGQRPSMPEVIRREVPSSVGAMVQMSDECFGEGLVPKRMVEVDEVEIMI